MTTNDLIRFAVTFEEGTPERAALALIGVRDLLAEKRLKMDMDLWFDPGFKASLQSPGRGDEPTVADICSTAGCAAGWIAMDVATAFAPERLDAGLRNASESGIERAFAEAMERGLGIRPSSDRSSAEYLAERVAGMPHSAMEDLWYTDQWSGFGADDLRDEYNFAEPDDRGPIVAEAIDRWFEFHFPGETIDEVLVRATRQTMAALPQGSAR